MNKAPFYALACVGALMFVVSCGQKSQSPAGAGEETAIRVVTTSVSEEIVTGYRQFPAYVVPLNETELRAEVNGYITRIHVADGASVSAGQALYEIDPTRYAASLDQAKANLAIAQANEERLQRDLKRYQTLAEKDAIARQVLDNTATELSNAQAQVQAMQAALNTAEINLNRSIIRAPFSGVIGISEVRQGALVTAGSTLINTISGTNPIGVDFQVNESDLQQIIEIQQQGGGQRDSSITLRLPGGVDYPLSGRIATLDRTINRNTGTIMVRAQFENPQGQLRAGSSAVLSIRQTSPQAKMVIPYKAVTEQLGQSVVYVVDGESRVEQRIVQLGLKTGEDIVIEEGLIPGETVVIEGLLNIRHGALVQAEEN